MIAWSTRGLFFSEFFNIVLSKGSEKDINLSKIIIARTQRYRPVTN